MTANIIMGVGEVMRKMRIRIMRMRMGFQVSLPSSLPPSPHHAVDGGGVVHPLLVDEGVVQIMPPLDLRLHHLVGRSVPQREYDDNHYWGVHLSSVGVDFEYSFIEECDY